MVMKPPVGLLEIGEATLVLLTIPDELWPGVRKLEEACGAA
jgi:hypothetical protein